MSIFNINFPTFVKEMLPFSKRLPIITNYLSSLMFPNQRINDLVANDYKNGNNTYNAYSTASTYNIGDRVVSNYDRKKVIFESIVDNNINISLSATNSWLYILPSNISYDERIKYNCSKTILEFALNRYFLGTFSQPMSGGASSSIYIYDDPIIFPDFLVGSTEDSSDVIGYDTGSGFIYATDSSISWSTNYNYTVYVDKGMFGTTFSQLSGGSASIKNFVDQYNAFGIKYDVKPYTP